MPYRIPDFNIRAIQRPDGKRPVHGEFHVSRSRCFFAGGGYLLAKIRGRIHHLPKRHIVVGEKVHLDALPHIGVVIDNLGH